MKNFLRQSILLILLVYLSGCATGGDVEMQVQKLRGEYKKELDESMRAHRREYREANELFRKDVKKDLDDSKRELRKEFREADELLLREIKDFKAHYEKNIKEINLTLIELQKDFLQNKKVVDDNARRIYLIESIITARRVIPHEQKEGFISFLEGEKVAISLGSNHGVKVGNKFSVYKGSTLKYRIGSIKIVDVEMDSSRAEIIEQEEKFTIEDRVEIER